MFKNIVKNIIYYIIQLIEKYEYRNFNSNENDITKKIINTIFLDNNIYVDSDKGFVQVDEINITQPFQKYKLELENGLILEGADNHVVICDGNIAKLMTELTDNDYVITKEGLSKVKSIKKVYGKISMFDLSINTPDMTYYTNDILSHNTVSTAIYIIWYALFNRNKGIMIVANKSKTTKEIINKIKGIYKLLPFFLKEGVLNWNENSISFENGSRIQTEARTAEPAIGFTIDLLYLDEFAKVPDSIIRKYYGEIVPVVSSIENSKIIITSTPDGFNLFWELITGAEKPEDDDDYNGYKPMRVYWYEKVGRRDTKIITSKARLKKYSINGLNKTFIKEHLKTLGYKLYGKVENGEEVIYIKFFKDEKEKYPAPKTSIDDIRKIVIPINGKNIPIIEISRVTNWELEQTKLIGGQSMFRQEFGLEFVTDDKTLFDTIRFQKMTQNIKEYAHIQIDKFSSKLPIPYTNLQFVQDTPELFDLSSVKNYYIFIGIDLAEGLGMDYSVINIFRVLPKDLEWIENNNESINNLYDLFKLEQIGMWRSNVYKTNEVAHILYMLAFELFDPEKVKIIIEMNKNLGNLLIQSMPYVFDGNNDYGDFIFSRFKHNKNDKFTKKGLLIGRDKKYMIKEFQDNIIKDNLFLNNKDNIIELKTFVKKETPSGDITYKSQSGHDDMVMSCVNLSAIFEHQNYKEFIEMYIENGLTPEYEEVIFGYKDRRGDNSSNIIADTYNKIYNKGATLDSNNKLSFNGNKYNLNIKNIDNWYKN